MGFDALRGGAGSSSGGDALCANGAGGARWPRSVVLPWCLQPAALWVQAIARRRMRQLQANGVPCCELTTATDGCGNSS